MFVEIEKLLVKSIKRANIADELEIVKIMEVGVAVISEILRKDVSGKIQLMGVKDGKLSLACTSSVLAQECYAKRSRIIFELNRPFKRGIIKQLSISS